MEIDRIDITAQLFALQDKAYADFQSKLLPTVQHETVIGVRTPDLRKMAKQICKTPAAQEFLHSLPHRYFDENQLHAIVTRLSSCPSTSPPSFRMQARTLTSFWHGTDHIAVIILSMSCSCGLQTS